MLFCILFCSANQLLTSPETVQESQLSVTNHMRMHETCSEVKGLRQC
jgi:hypothetical protein